MQLQSESDMKNKNPNINGLLLVNKPKDITSFKVTKTVEKILNVKTGHAGTLDPFAEGLMIIGINKATKTLEYFTNFNKEYLAKCQWGQETDTLDRDGKTIKTTETNINFDKISEILKIFTGEISQIPPQYSALKIDGKRCYELARKGKEIAITPRQITIYQIENTANDLNNNSSSFYIKCSKGTYIRSLIRDIGYALNNLAYTSELIRTKIGEFNLNDSINFADLDKSSIQEILSSKAFIDISDIRINHNIISLNAEEYEAFSHGKQITRNNLHFLETDVINTLFQGKLIGFSKISCIQKEAISPIKVFI
jgi:tRNA pseudouridine55 synthase